MWVVLIAASITETHAPDASLRGEDGTELRIKAGEISKEREMRFVKDFSVVSDTKTTRDSLKNGEWTKHFVYGLDCCIFYRKEMGLQGSNEDSVDQLI